MVWEGACRLRPDLSFTHLLDGLNPTRPHKCWPRLFSPKSKSYKLRVAYMTTYNMGHIRRSIRIFTTHTYVWTSSLTHLYNFCGPHLITFLGLEEFLGWGSLSTMVNFIVVHSPTKNFIVPHLVRSKRNLCFWCGKINEFHPILRGWRNYGERSPILSTRTGPP